MYKIEKNQELNSYGDNILRVKSDDLEDVLKPNVSPEGLRDLLNTIHDWYDKEEHLPRGALHDQVIIRHLITSSYSLEKVKRKIDNFYSAKSKMAEILTCRDPKSSNLDKYLRQGYWIILPQRTPDKDRVTIFRIKEKTDFLVNDIVKLIFMMGEYRMHNDAALAEHWIFDFKNTTVQHALQLTPVLISQFMFFVTACIGPKIKGFYLTNVPPYAETLLNIFKKTMKAKLIERVFIYNKLEDILKLFPKEIIPRDLGGDDISCDEITENWMRVIQSPPWRQYFITQDVFQTDESKRSRKSKFDGDFGTEGSFKKLEFD